MEDDSTTSWSHLTAKINACLGVRRTTGKVEDDSKLNGEQQYSIVDRDPVKVRSV